MQSVCFVLVFLNSLHCDHLGLHWEKGRCHSRNDTGVSENGDTVFQSKSHCGLENRMDFGFPLQDPFDKKFFPGGYRIVKIGDPTGEPVDDKDQSNL